MKLNYTYGQPSLTVKQATVNSYNEFKGRHNMSLTEAVKFNRNRLKGQFNPRLYLGNGRLFKIKDTWNGYDFAVKKLIAGCFIDFMAVKSIGFMVEEPEFKRIKADIDVMLFNREEFKSSEYAAYRDQWNKISDKIIEEIRNKVVNGWKDGKPCDEIVKFFGDKWQTYGVKRQYKNKGVSKTYAYMDSKDVNKIAKYLAANGINKVVNTMKECKALTRRGISISDVNMAIAQLVNDNKGKDIVETFKKGLSIINWLKTLNGRQLKDLHIINNMDDRGADMYLNAYGFNMKWKCNGYLKFIMTGLDNRIKEINNGLYRKNRSCGRISRAHS